MSDSLTKILAASTIKENEDFSICKSFLKHYDELYNAINNNHNIYFVRPSLLNKCSEYIQNYVHYHDLHK